MSIAARIGSSLIVPPSCEDPMRLQPSVEQVPDQARRSFVDATGLGRAREAVRPDKTSRGSRAGDDRAMDEEADKQVRYVEAPTQAVGSERTVSPAQAIHDSAEVSAVAEKGSMLSSPGSHQLRQTTPNGERMLSRVQVGAEKGLKEPMVRSATAEGATPPKDGSGLAENVVASNRQFVGKLAKTSGEVSGEAGNVARTRPTAGKRLMSGKPQMGEQPGHVYGKKLTAQQNAGSNTHGPGQTASRAHPFTVERGSHEQLGKSDPGNRKSAVAALNASGRGAGTLRSDSRKAGLGGGGGTHVRQTVNTGAAMVGEQEISPSDSGKGPTVQLEPVVSVAGEPAPAPPPASAQIPLPMGAEGTMVKSPTQNIGEQILDSVHASLVRGEGQLVIRLHPPELGNVLMRFRDDGNQIQGILEVSKSDTRYEIEQALPGVLRSLQDSGIQVKRFEVVVADQPEREPDEEQLQQDTRPRQHGPDQYVDRQQRSWGTGWSADGSEHQSAIEYSESRQLPVGAASDHIDMLI